MADASAAGTDDTKRAGPRVCADEPVRLEVMEMVIAVMIADGAGWSRSGGYVLAHVSLDALLVLVTAAAVVVVALFARGHGRRAVPRALVGTAVAAIGFQVVHLGEHVLQLGYWILHPAEAPWLTPWAILGRDALATMVDGRAGTGTELLHLAGNVVFLVGLVAAVLALRLYNLPAAGLRRLRRALYVQAVHVAEHLLLTLTWLIGGQALGLSTGLGLLEPGAPVTGGVRVWVHFAVNFIATAYAVGGVQELHTVLQSQRPARPRSRQQPARAPLAPRG